MDASNILLFTHSFINPAHLESHCVLSCVPAVRLKQAPQEGHQLGFLGTGEGQVAKGIRESLLGEGTLELKNAGN